MTDKLTLADVQQMDVTERLNHIAKLSPEMDNLIQNGRTSGMSDMLIFEHFLAACDMKEN